MARNPRRDAGSCDSLGSRRLPLDFVAPRYWPAWLLVAWMWVAARLPTRTNIRLHKLSGRLAGRLLAPGARIVRRNLELCFPERSSDEIEELMRRHYEAIGACVGETAAAWFGCHDRLHAMLEVEGREHLDAAVAEGRGVLLYTGHFTPLEITGPLLAALTDRFAFMFNTRRNPLLCEIQRRGRARAADRFFPKGDVRAMLRGLRDNAVVWYAADEPASGSHAALVPFFGVPAMTNTAVSRIARLSGARVLPFSFRRRADDSAYVLVFEPPLESFPSTDPVADTRRLVERLEHSIRRAPEQYMWAHKKFRGRPPPLPDVYARAARPARARRRRRSAWRPLAAAGARAVYTGLGSALRAGSDAAARTVRAAGARLRRPIADDTPDHYSVPTNVLRGIAIGTAHLVPGLGSGTVALLVGVYQRLMRVLARIDAVWVRLLLERRFAEALRRLDILFVLPIAAGILCAAFVLSRALPLELLIAEMPEMTFGLVFGLVTASILRSLSGVDRWCLAAYVWLAAGIAVGASLVLVVPADTPSGSVFLFLSGVIAAVAMLTPGLSASLVLLVLGKYFDLLNALARGDWAVLLPAAAGVFAGAALFARIMAWLLDRHRQPTMLAVTGLVGGSLLALWPFQEWVVTEVGGRMHLAGAAPYMPQTLDLGVVMGVAAMFAGIVAFRMLARAAPVAGPVAVAERGEARVGRDP